MNPEHQAVDRYRKFARKFIPQDKLKNLAEFSWRVQNDLPPSELLGRYPTCPKQILDVLWWNGECFEAEGGYILRLFDDIMMGDPSRVLQEGGFLPIMQKHEKEIIEETLYTTILKALAIGSLDIELPQEKTAEQTDGMSLLSLM